jgi:hypothetical protein
MLFIFLARRYNPPGLFIKALQALISSRDAINRADDWTIVPWRTSRRSAAGTCKLILVASSIVQPVIPAIPPAAGGIHPCMY